MQENFELVQRGFRILVSSMSGYIGQELNKTYKNNWWNEVLTTLYDQRDLPSGGNYGDLVDSLDIANCIRLLDRRWHDVFRNVLPQNCRTWARELMGVRNIVAHIGQQDLEQPMAERALDTMALLCKEMDSEGAEEIREIYRSVRARAGEQPIQVEFSGLAQPASDSKRGALTEGSLLQLVDTEIVQKTTLTRKVTYGGKTVVYPVYRVRLDYLYYNDQNDRISTWITRYESENGTESLSDLNVDIYNRIIENFICESNPEAIKKTQKNIALVGQREPGVTLADGRIVDGNRRYTCLRKIQRETSEPIYFETVIMDMDIREDKKQIKLLELAIQHGEEKKVDYDLIDYAVGTYRDVVQTKLLTVEEYATSTNEAVADVKKRIEIAGVICEFLDYLKLPEQYHVAREYQVYSLFQEMMAPLRQLDDDGKQQLKRIAFNNAMMKAIPDQRKFIRDIKGLIKNGTYNTYFEEQQELGKIIKEKFDQIVVHAKEDVDKFAEENISIGDELQLSMERALLKSRSQLLRNKPSENVSKSIALLTDVDSRLFSKMDVEDKEELKAGLDELANIVDSFRKML
ncbi:Swt1 family HEPN domain-containing protein [Butyrivibrio sp. LC3010]|uniref:Swt1 family HEPN domain-containing protein n=1 Tax=Butyrivibrio sp. LC3010 TaxID=1280680 RepID=UPI000677E8D1|nr:Swt1 family HEPN domain-containing protein [Butyrivibrio sp. LC3010]